MPDDRPAELKPPGAGAAVGERLPGPTTDSMPPWPRRTIASRVRAYRRFWIIAATVFALDQATKLWIAANVPFDPRHVHGAGVDHEIIRGFFYIIHVGNTGAAWSMFAGQSVLLALVALCTLAAIFFWRRSLGLRDPVAQVSFGLLCGGSVGNLVDRLLHGHVIDFIDLHFGNYIYPTFNVADSGICIGVLLYLWISLRSPAPEKSSSA